MLPRVNRINKKEMMSLNRPTKRINQKGLSVSYYANEGVFKVAVVVSKKVSKKAVTRNRIRRWLYTITRLWYSKIPSGCYVIRLQPTARSYTKIALQNELAMIFGEISKAR